MIDQPPKPIGSVIRPSEIADRLKLDNADLSGAMLRLRRRGLAMFRLGRTYVCTEQDLQDFIADQRQQGSI